MSHTGTVVIFYDVAARVDPMGKAKARAREINPRKLAPTQQITMAHTGTHILSHDIAARVDPDSDGQARAREINRSEGVGLCQSLRGNAQHEAKREQVKC